MARKFIIQNKRHKLGMKLYILTEPNGIAQDVIVYTGAMDPDVGGRGHANRVVRKLMDRFFSVGTVYAWTIIIIQLNYLVNYS